MNQNVREVEVDGRNKDSWERSRQSIHQFDLNIQLIQNSNLNAGQRQKAQSDSTLAALICFTLHQETCDK